MIKSINTVKQKLRAGWVLTHCGAWWLLPALTGDNTETRVSFRRGVHHKTAKAVTEDTDFVRLDTRKNKAVGTWGVAPEIFSITMIATLDNGYEWRTTSGEVPGPESAARKHARRAVLKVLGDAKVRIVNVYHNRKAEQRAALAMSGGN